MSDMGDDVVSSGDRILGPSHNRLLMVGNRVEDGVRVRGTIREVDAVVLLRAGWRLYIGPATATGGWVNAGTDHSTLLVPALILGQWHRLTADSPPLLISLVEAREVMEHVGALSPRVAPRNE